MKKIVSLLVSVFLVVTFAQAVTLTIVQPEGEVTVTRPVGSRVTFKSLEEGIIKWWKVITGNVEVEDGGFIMPSNNVTVEAMKTGNVITVVQTNGGKITPGSVGVEENGSRTFTMTPNEGYEVIDVLVDGSSVKSSLSNGTGDAKKYTFTNVTAPHTITATYAIKKYTITATAGTGGTISPTLTEVEYGGNATFTITQNNGYVLSSLKVDGNAVDTVLSYTITNVQKATTITADFSPISYTISYDLDGGTGSNPTSYTIETESFTLNEPTREGYTFTGWTGTGLSSATTSVTIAKGSTGDRNYTANWEETFIQPKADTSGANAPVTTTGLTPVNWNGSSWEETTKDNWKYNYNTVATEVQTRKDGKGDGAWANAQTADGSLYVWIPRYTYRITEENGYHQDVDSWNADSGDNKTGKIEIIFSNGTTDTVTSTTGLSKDGYIKHPAFTFGDDELKGIWVAKYEASMEDGSGNHVDTSSETIGNVVLSDSVKLVSKPNVSSWRYISVSNMFDNSYNLNRDLDSHLMKNVEWGAVAYLTNAIGRIPYINNSTDYITGNAGESQDASGTSDITNAWNTTGGVKASTTHNVYGIYDMSGGGNEYVSAYFIDGNTSFLSEDVSNKAYAGSLYTFANNIATAKYVDTYSTAYTESQTGDAMYEISNKGSAFSYSAWDGDTSQKPYETSPLFTRGRYNDSNTKAGIFAFYNSAGVSNSKLGFRPVLCVK